MWGVFIFSKTFHVKRFTGALEYIFLFHMKRAGKTGSFKANVSREKKIGSMRPYIAHKVSSFVHLLPFLKKGGLVYLVSRVLHR